MTQLREKPQVLPVAAAVLLWLGTAAQALERTDDATKGGAEAGACLRTLPLPGGLNKVPVLNSNSPEVVTSPGILVSTFPPANRPFKGRFDVFLHHIARAADDSGPTLYVAVLLRNSTAAPVTVRVLSAASYLSQPDAPFIPQPDLIDDPEGKVFAGPGDRVAADVLRGKRQPGWPDAVVVPAHSLALLSSLPIPVTGLVPPLNGRSLLACLQSNGPIYAAVLADFSKTAADGSQMPPTLDDWRSLWSRGVLAGPREKAPSAPGAPGPVAYGRVSGVACGNQWTGVLSDSSAGHQLSFTQAQQAFAFPLSTVERATVGTGQVQSAPLAFREPDTAWAAHGNYAVAYHLTAPLVNLSRQPLEVSLLMHSPETAKKDCPPASVQAQQRPDARVHFRGSLRLDYQDEHGQSVRRYVHVVQRVGETSQPLVRLRLRPHQRQALKLALLYPPDATPPQVLIFQAQSAH